MLLNNDTPQVARRAKRGSAYVEYRDTDRFELLATELLPVAPIQNDAASVSANAAPHGDMGA